MRCNAKPCLASSDWYFANWVRDHVQWEVLESFALVHELGVDRTALDDDIDWSRYHAGVTWAAVRWLLNAEKDNWRPHNLPASLDLYREGYFDGCLPDTHNSTTGLYGRMAISARRGGGQPARTCLRHVHPQPVPGRFSDRHAVQAGLGR